MLEKQEDEKGIFKQAEIIDPTDQIPLNNKQIEVMKRLWNVLDGLTPLSIAMKKLADISTYEIIKGVDRLLAYQLVGFPETDFSVPLDKFRQLCRRVAEKIGVERNIAFLRLSLAETMSYSVRARKFAIASSGEVGIDMVAARSSGGSLSSLIKDIEDWQVKYIEYVSQELNSKVLLSFIEEIHQQ